MTKGELQDSIADWKAQVADGEEDLQKYRNYYMSHYSGRQCTLTDDQLIEHVLAPSEDDNSPAGWAQDMYHAEERLKAQVTSEIESEAHELG